MKKWYQQRGGGTNRGRDKLNAQIGEQTKHMIRGEETKPTGGAEKGKRLFLDIFFT